MTENQSNSQATMNEMGFLTPIKNIGKGIINQLKIISTSPFGFIGLIGMTIFIIMAVFAPALAPYPPYKETYHANGDLAFLEPPSWEHPFGTTLMAQDILSQIIWGTRRTLIIALTAAFCAAFIGTNIGLISGYMGGKVDMFLMRMTDIAYGIPFIPFAMVAILILGRGDFVLVAIISSILWRTTSRVIRSQVLTLKERPFIAAAKSMGASTNRILYRHIMPNVIPLSFLYSLIIAGDAVLVEASLSFLGLGNPNTISWGQILFYCFSSQRMRTAWWWGVFPGVSIVLLVLSAFFIGRSYEETINPRLREI